MRIFLTAFLLSFALTSAASEPVDTLDAYFRILTTRNYDGLENLMAASSMNDLKVMMDEAITYQTGNGVYRLQERIFGRRVSQSEVAGASARFYLRRLAKEILEAAQAQHLIVQKRDIIGAVNEGENTVHIVARLTMEQDGRTGTDVLLYTLIREQEGWKLTFPATIRQMLTVIEASARQP